MKWLNDRVIHGFLADYAQMYGRQGLGKKIAELESRIDELAVKISSRNLDRKPGRPKKVDYAKND